MTNPNLTSITFILDRSGSMESIQSKTVEGYNAFISDQKKCKEGDAILTLIQFDDEYEVHQKCIKMEDVPELNEESYVPRGTTALLDAIGKTINVLGEEFSKMSEADRPGKVLIAILTDGFENASEEFNAQDINKMIKKQREVYKWEFMFLGASQDSMNDAVQKYGIPKSTAAVFNTGNIKSVMCCASSMVKGARGMSGKCMAFSSKDREDLVKKTGNKKYTSHSTSK